MCLRQLCSQQLLQIVNTKFIHKNSAHALSIKSTTNSCTFTHLQYCEKIYIIQEKE